MVVAVPAWASLSGASEDSNTLFRFNAMVGNTLTGADGAIRGVNAGGAPWVVAEGGSRLKSDGKLRVDVEGLLLAAGPAQGTVGPVTGVRASLTCDGTDVVATTGVFALSSEGDAQIKETIALPSSCLAPIVLVRIGSTASNPGPLMGPWIAASGF